MMFEAMKCGKINMAIVAHCEDNTLTNGVAFMKEPFPKNTD